MKFFLFISLLFLTNQTYSQEKTDVNLQKKHLEKYIKIKLFEEYLQVNFVDSFPKSLNDFFEVTLKIDTLKSIGFDDNIIFLSVKSVTNKKDERLLPPYIFSSAPRKSCSYVFLVCASFFEDSPFLFLFQGNYSHNFKPIYRIDGFSKDRNDFKVFLDDLAFLEIYHDKKHEKKLLKNIEIKNIF